MVLWRVIICMELSNRCHGYLHARCTDSWGWCMSRGKPLVLVRKRNEQVGLHEERKGAVRQSGKEIAGIRLVSSGRIGRGTRCRLLPILSGGIIIIIA